MEGRPPPIEVLHVISSNARRGAETFAWELHCEMVRRGVRSEIVALRPGGGVTLDVRALSANRWTSMAALRRVSSTAAVVIAHGSSTLLACALVVPRRVPFVYRTIGDTTYWASSPLRRLRVRAFLGRASRVTVLWPGAGTKLETVLRVAPEKIRVVPNAVATERFAVPTPTARADARAALGVASPVIVYVGALSEEKNPVVLAEVAARTNASLVVAGTGPLAPQLEQSLRAHKVQGKLLGSVDDVRAVYAAADVFVLPSRSEGIPAVLIEAGLSGVPCVATDVGGCAEVVIDGATGRLVASGDPALLTPAIQDVLARRDEFGAAARAHCLARFDLRTVADRWIDILVEARRDYGRAR